MDRWRTARCSNIPEEAHMREVSAVLCALLLTAAAGCGGLQPSTASPSPIIASNFLPAARRARRLRHRVR